MNNIDGRLNLLEFDLPGLTSWFVDELEEPPYRALQVWQWLWQKMAQDFESMSNVSKALRAKLVERAEIAWPKIVSRQKSVDGTTKFLLQLADGARIETALIPAENRAGNIRWSQCLSTQVGCPMGCTFCATGKMGFVRNMTRGEIMGQVLIGRDHLADRRLDWPVLRNLVFMGMGEPLLNLKELLPALRGLGSDKGMNFSPRRMTVSTCGIPSGLRELGESGLAFLAVSLHAPNQTLREQIMPGAAGWPLDDMMATLESYPLKTRERITFEYLLLKGVNDRLEHARQLARLVSGVKSKINLILFNPVPDLPYERPDEKAVEAFQKYLFDKNIMSIVRKSRGADIAAACGQLYAVNTREA